MRIIGRSRRHPPPPGPRPVGASAPSIGGESLAGEPVEVAAGAGATILVFITSDCAECQGLWRGMSAVRHPVVLVTPDPSTQSRRALRSLAPAGCEVFMSSAAWHAYGVTGAPWCVVVEAGRIVASGPGGSDWAELMATAGAAVAGAGGGAGRDG